MMVSVIGFVGAFCGAAAQEKHRENKRQGPGRKKTIFHSITLPRLWGRRQSKRLGYDHEKAGLASGPATTIDH